MSIRVKIQSFLKKYAPFVIEWGRAIKKKNKRRTLEDKKQRGQVITKEQLKEDLEKMGIHAGDTVMVHCALSKIGFVDGGAACVVDALLETIGPQGNLLMPSFAHQTFSKYYLDTDPVFDVRNTPSGAGAVTESFRKRNGVKRSLHPTDSVAAYGPLSDHFTSTHFGELTPYTERSPYFKLAEKGGKILNIGVPLNTSCTNLHTLEDAVDFRFPIYHSKIYTTRLVDEQGRSVQMQTKVHDPVFSQKRRPDELVPMFEREGVLLHGKFGEADVMLVDAKRLFTVMVDQYYRNGVTMYTPHGGSL